MTTDQFKKEYVIYRDREKVIANITQDIENLYYELSGVKGVDMTKIPVAFNKEMAEEKKHEIIDFIATKQIEEKKIRLSIKLMENLLPRFTEEQIQILDRILIDKESYESVGKDFGYSASSMWRHVENFISEVLNK